MEGNLLHCERPVIDKSVIPPDGSKRHIRVPGDVIHPVFILLAVQYVEHILIAHIVRRYQKIQQQIHIHHVGDIDRILQISLDVTHHIISLLLRIGRVNNVIRLLRRYFMPDIHTFEQDILLLKVQEFCVHPAAQGKQALIPAIHHHFHILRGRHGVIPVLRGGVVVPHVHHYFFPELGVIEDHGT